MNVHIAKWRLFVKNKANKFIIGAYILIFLALTFGFFTRIFSAFSYTTFDIGGSPDQVRDAFVYMDMWQGKWPILGPSVSKAEYSLPPLYYYLVFPFTALGANPVFQVLPNALFSFLSIPLLIYLVYKLLENLEFPPRLFLSALAGFWYSLLFVDIFLSTFHWNPSPIPFFLISFTLLSNYLLEITSISLPLQLISWMIYGVILAILVSLHSTTLFVIPIVFFTVCLVYTYKKRNYPQQLLMPIVSIVTAIIALLPYWKGEVSRDWINTKKIIFTVINSSQQANNYTIWDRLARAVYNYLELGRQAYFIGSSWLHISVSFIFLSLIILAVIIRFKGNKNIVNILLLTGLIYLYIASNYFGNYLTYYKLIILFFPILFTVITLSALNLAYALNKIIVTALVIGILWSSWTNLVYDYKYWNTKYGPERLITTSEMINIIKEIPEKSTICDPRYKGWRKLYHPYLYIDKYITHKQIKLVKECQSGNYRLYSKYQFKFDPLNKNLAPVFTLIPNLAFQQEASLLKEYKSVYVYVLK